MRILIADLLRAPDTALDFSETLRYEGEPFEYIEAVGRVENKSGVTTLSCSVTVPLTLTCDRCLREFGEHVMFSFERTVVEQVFDESHDDEYLVPDADGRVDLAEVCREEVYLGFPPVTLCEPDCKGLCPKCGRNLNEGDCGCDLREPDPRFQKLYELLDK